MQVGDRWPRGGPGAPLSSGLWPHVCLSTGWGRTSHAEPSPSPEPELWAGTSVSSVGLPHGNSLSRRLWASDTLFERLWQNAHNAKPTTLCAQLSGIEHTHIGHCRPSVSRFSSPSGPSVPMKHSLPVPSPSPGHPCLCRCKSHDSRSLVSLADFTERHVPKGRPCCSWARKSFLFQAEWTALGSPFICGRAPGWLP